MTWKEGRQTGGRERRRAIRKRGEERRIDRGGREGRNGKNERTMEEEEEKNEGTKQSSSVAVALVIWI